MEHPIYKEEWKKGNSAHSEDLIEIFYGNRYRELFKVSHQLVSQVHFLNTLIFQRYGLNEHFFLIIYRLCAFRIHNYFLPDPIKVTGNYHFQTLYIIYRNLKLWTWIYLVFNIRFNLPSAKPTNEWLFYYYLSFFFKRCLSDLFSTNGIRLLSTSLCQDLSVLKSTSIFGRGLAIVFRWFGKAAVGIKWAV